MASDYLPAMMHPKPTRQAAIDRDQAEALAVRALAFLASDSELLPRFLSITGIESSQVRQAAREPGFLAGVLQFIAAHEPTLTRFSAECDVEPGSVLAAIRALPFGDDRYMPNA